jgi:hypothetical protein
MGAGERVDAVQLGEPVSNTDDLTTVIRLACLTEDRSDAEQRALLRVARKVDQEVNANVTGNDRMWDHAGSTRAVRLLPESILELEVEQTRLLDDGQHEVHLPVKAKRTKVETAPG